jgi:hypothetical protein
MNEALKTLALLGDWAIATASFVLFYKSFGWDIDAE